MVALIFTAIAFIFWAVETSGLEIGSGRSNAIPPSIIVNEDQISRLDNEQLVRALTHDRDCKDAKDGEFVPDRQDHTKYFVCLDEGLASETSRPCPGEGACFDSNNRSCTTDKVICKSLMEERECKVACDKFGDNIADQTNCNRHFLCLGDDIDGKIELYCPAERPYFNGFACVSNMSQCCACEREECEVSGQKIPDPTNCQAYYFCIDPFKSGKFIAEGPISCKPHEFFVNGDCESMDKPCKNACPLGAEHHSAIHEGLQINWFLD